MGMVRSDGFGLVSKVDIYTGVETKSGHHMFFNLMNNAEIPDQLLYITDGDDVKLQKDFLTRLCSVFVDDEKYHFYKVKVTDDAGTMEVIVEFNKEN